MRRVAERRMVRQLGGRPPQAGALAIRLQQRQPPLITGKPNTAEAGRAPEQLESSAQHALAQNEDDEYEKHAHKLSL